MNKHQWNRWFAWYPILIENDEVRAIVFFETIERRDLGGRMEYRFAA